MDRAIRRFHHRLKDGSVDRTRVLLIGKRMPRDVIEELLAAQPDIDVVATEDVGVPLVSAIDRTGASLVIFENGDETSEPFVELLRQRPRIKAIAIEDEGRQTFLYELRPHKVALGELSPEALIEAVRSASAALKDAP